MSSLGSEEIGGGSGETCHVAIIMDGNGRWAQARGLPRSAGHYFGTEAARRIVRAAPGEGVSGLTLFAFSTENWRRPPAEVEGILALLRDYLRRDVEDLHARGVRLSVIGRRSALPKDIVGLIGDAEARMAVNAGLRLTIALDYGGRTDLVAAARAVATRIAAGDMAVEDIDEALFERLLQSRGLPDVDLLIRSGGDRRISNFLPWQTAYAELYFSAKPWPDFRAEDLRAALADLRGRERRFGGLAPAQILRRARLTG